MTYKDKIMQISEEKCLKLDTPRAFVPCVNVGNHVAQEIFKRLDKYKAHHGGISLNKKDYEKAKKKWGIEK